MPEIRRTRSLLTLLVSVALFAPAAPALATGTGSIQVLTPNGGEQLRGSTTISWAYTTGSQVSDDSTVTVLFTPDDGGSFSTIAASLPITDLSTAWDTTTASDADAYRIRIRVNGQPARTDNSNSVFTVDNTAPTVTSSALTSPNGGEFLRGGAIHNITWNAGGIGDAHLGAAPIKLEYTTDGTVYTTIAAGEANDGTFDWTVPAIDAAAARVRLSATDTVGNSASDVSDADLAIDSTLPSVSAAALTFPNGGELLSGGSTQVITWEPTAVTDTNLGATPVTLAYSLDGLTFTTISEDEANDGSFGWEIPALDSETVRLRLTATDLAGNAASDDSDADFTIDATDPGITLTAPSGGEEFRGGDELDISWLSTDDHFGATPVDIDFTTDGAGFTPIAAGQSADGTFTWTIPSLDSDTVQIRVRATDGAGNTASDLSSTFAVDSTAPTVALVSPAGGEALQGGATTTIRFSGSDEVELVGFSLEYSSDGGGSFSPIGTAGPDADSLDWSVPALNTADVLVRVTATDGVGNATTATSGGFIIDSTDPGVTLDTPIAGDDVANAAEASSLAVSGTASDALSGVDSVLVAATDGTTTTEEVSATLDGGTFEADLDISGLDDGAITIRAVADDEAGNDTGTSHEISLDATAPNVTLDSTPPTVTNQTSASFTYSAPEASTFSCSVDGAAFDSCSSPSDYTNLAEGAHSFAVRARDAAGNTGATATFPWTVDLTAPTTMITGKPVDPTADTNATFVFNADELASFLCSIDAGAEEVCTSPATYTGLAEGAHSFSVRATDPAGNAGPAVTAGWTVDLTGPSVSLTGPASPTNETDAVLSFGSVDGGISFRCSLDGSEAAGCTSPVTLSELADGTHVFGVRATDQAGNEGGESTFLWVVDTAAPTVEIVSAPTDPANSSTAVFSVIASEASIIECDLDGAGFEDCSSGSIGYTALDDGDHTFSVRATDPAGNTGVATTFSWTVDTVAPTASILAAPNAYSSSADAALSLDVDEEDATLSCSLDGGTPSDCSGGTAAYTALAEGSHLFEVAATDPAGNTGPAASAAWIVDLTAPTVDADTLTAPNGGEAVSGGDASTIAWDAAGVTDANLGTMPIALSFSTDGGGSFAPVAADEANDGTFDWTVPVVDTSGGIVRVTATDLAGNRASDESDGAFVVDSSAPAVSLEAPGGAGVIGAGEATAYEATGTASDAGAGLAGVRVSATDGTTTAGPIDAALGSGTFAAELDLTPLSEGAIFLRAVATDRAGRTAAHTQPATLDTEAPEVSLAGPIGGDGVISGSEAGALPLAGTASDSLTDIGSVRVSATDGTNIAGPVTATRQGDTWSATLDVSSLEDGAVVVRAVAEDLGGNTTAAEATATLDTTGPTASILSGPAALTSDAAASFTVEASEAGATLSCTLDGGAATDCSDGAAGYAGLPDGTHTFRVSATDAVGNTGAAAEHNWRVDTRAPTVTITGHPATLSGSASATFTFEADEAGAAFECELDGSGFAACPSDGVSYTGLDDGTHAFRVRATDPAGNLGAVAAFGWEIGAVAPIAIIDATPGVITNVSDATFSFHATLDGTTFECSLDGGAFEGCTSPATYPSLADGDHRFEVRGSFEGRTGKTATFTWAVDTVDPSVEIVSGPADPSPSTSATFGFDVSEQGARLECRMDDGDFSPCENPASFSDLAEGTHTLQVRATDAAGNSSEQATFSWTVDATLPAVQITSGPATATTSRSATFVFTTSEPASSTRCGLDGSALETCDGSVSYADVADGNHSVRIVATDAAGNEGEATSSWTVDNVNPTLNVQVTPTACAGAAWCNADVVRVIVTAADPGSGLAVDPSGTTEVTEEGVRTLTFTARDRAGNEATASVTLRVDRQAPQTTITAPGTGTVVVQPATGIFRATGTVTDRPAGENSGVKVTSVSLCRTPDTPPVCVPGTLAPSGATWTWQPSTQPLPGQYTLVVWAEDFAGNGPSGSFSGADVFII